MLKMNISFGTKIYIQELRDHCNISGSSKDSNENEIECIFLPDSEEESNKEIRSPYIRDQSLDLNNHSLLSPLKNCFTANNQPIVLTSLNLNNKSKSKQSYSVERLPEHVTFTYDSTINDSKKSNIYDRFIEKRIQSQLKSINKQKGQSNPGNTLPKKIYSSNENDLISALDVIDLT